MKNQSFVLSRFGDQFDDREIESVTTDDILSFLTPLTEGKKQSTKRNRYSILKSLFNFVINTFEVQFQNPCDSRILRKMFKNPRPKSWSIIEKDTIDEIIFKTDNPRNRIMLELMARGGMRIGEVLNLSPRDVEDRKLIIRDPKSGREIEVVYIPGKVAGRLKKYILDKEIQSQERIFPITYAGSRSVVVKAGEILGIRVRPHDLRRHCASFASRNGLPLEIISKLILRHANLTTTQRYLGKISESEAQRWIENLYS